MLNIRLLGNVELANDGVRLSVFPTLKSKTLFAMLVLGAGQVFSRERLVDRLWTNLTEAKGKKCLSSDLWRIKEVIKSGGLEPDTYLISRDKGIGFNASAEHSLDVQKFKDKLHGLTDKAPQNLSENELDALEKSVEIYRGDLLDDLYDDWILVQREALRAEYVRALEALMYYKSFQMHLAEAIKYGQKLLSLDPLLEHVHRELMLCYYRHGNRAAALKQYAQCEDVLWKELNVEPMEETSEIYQQLVSVGHVKLPASRATVLPKTSKSALNLSAESSETHFISDSMIRAMTKLESAHALLQKAQARLKTDNNNK